jgi:hypothetical protein
MNYTIRETCIFCDSALKKIYFEELKFNCHVAHYQCDDDYTDFQKIPFNVHICDFCNTAQNKYLGKLNEIYKHNHADSTGITMQTVHKLNKNMILKNANDIKNIIEIGSSRGVLADIILDTIKMDYYVIEPCYFGNTDNKIIINDFYENVDDTKLNANTIIISHVFEHFYEPKKILEKIKNNKNIEHFFLVFPDLEYYVNNEILHVLNTEHTYYIDNDFLIKYINLFNFKIIEKVNHNGHSVLFHFKREKETIDTKNFNFKNTNYSLETFYNKIFNKIAFFNKIIEEEPNKNIFMWPASIHTLYLFIFGLNHNKIKGFVDNSSLKIGKKMYGTNKYVYSFEEYVKNKDKKSILFVNGGVFNSEIHDMLIKNDIVFFM